MRIKAMHKTIKKLLFLSLSVCLILSFISTNAYADSWTYYPSGRLESWTLSVPDTNGNIYYHYLDEDWDGQVYGRVDRYRRSTPDADGARSFILKHPISVVVADLDGNGRDDLIVDCGGNGLWKYMNNSAWEKISDYRRYDAP